MGLAHSFLLQAAPVVVLVVLAHASIILRIDGPNGATSRKAPGGWQVLEAMYGV
ncbi:hypothetical protein ACIQZB_28320 [Streptomyces sp. NPDC097727]|uniref:hypothetical protein n=1 Tax=Streptomyces sp. NPDC097727 TaxID=3366092 RepID=UPI003823C577